MSILTPNLDCCECSRLVKFRACNIKKFAGKHNAPVPSFGPENAELLIVGLAPGLKGANFTGRPFTGDYAGDLLYKTLNKYEFSNGTYGSCPHDGLNLKRCRITNAVRCVPPENKPTGNEIKQCQKFLDSELKKLTNLRVVLALGKIAHDAILRSSQLKLSDYKFVHNTLHTLPSGITLIDSYHCSRYNTQTKRLTPEMFEAVFESISNLLDK